MRTLLRLDSEGEGAIPDDYVCLQVIIPNSPANIGALVTSLHRLSTWREWERDDLRSGANNASLWRQANELTFDNSITPNCTNDDPDNPNNGGENPPYPTLGEYQSMCCNCCNSNTPTVSPVPDSQLLTDPTGVTIPIPPVEPVSENLCRLTQWAVHEWVRVMTDLVNRINVSTWSEVWEFLKASDEGSGILQIPYRLVLVFAGMMRLIGLIPDIQINLTLQALSQIRDDLPAVASGILCAENGDAVLSFLQNRIVSYAAGIDARLAVALAWAFQFIDTRFFSDVTEYMDLVPPSFVSGECTCSGGGGGEVVPTPEGYTLIPFALDSVVRGTGVSIDGSFIASGLNADDTVFSLSQPVYDSSNPVPVLARRGVFIRVSMATTSTPAITSFMGQAANTSYLFSVDHDPLSASDTITGAVNTDPVALAWASSLTPDHTDTDLLSDVGTPDGYSRIQVGSKFVSGEEDAQWGVSFYGYWLVLNEA